MNDADIEEPNREEEMEEEDEPVKDLGFNKINFAYEQNSLRQSFLNNSNQRSPTKITSLLAHNRTKLISSKLNERLSNLNYQNRSFVKKQINLNNLNVNLLEDVDKRMMSLMPNQESLVSGDSSNSSAQTSLTNVSGQVTPSSSQSQMNSLETNGNGNMFMSSYNNSLMNVSMLDNIQIANNSLVDFDNMNSSILMFN